MILPATLKGRYIERMTDEEFFHFCQDNKEFKFERTSDGQIIVMSPTGFTTGDRNSEVIAQLRQWNKKYRLGRTVDSDTGFYLPNGAMRNPDTAWISHERLSSLNSEQLKRFPHVCPDFVVELRSESDSLAELQEKMREWMSNGCRLGWLIDAEEEIVYVYNEDGSDTIHHGFDASLSGEAVLPGFSLILSELRV